MTSYVAGFMFDLVTKEVALIRKKKPLWQAGKLNGIGGKMEPAESAAAAMVREFEEETSYLTAEHEWRQFASLLSRDWCVHFFFTFGHLSELESPEEEKIEIHDIALIPQMPDVVENLYWLLGLAIDATKPGGPSFVIAHYNAL